MTLPAGWEEYQTNFLGLEEPWCHQDQAGVYILPAPYEQTSSYVPGSDQGPFAIIEASYQVEFYDEMLPSFWRGGCPSREGSSGTIH